MFSYVVVRGCELTELVRRDEQYEGKRKGGGEEDRGEGAGEGEVVRYDRD